MHSTPCRRVMIQVSVVATICVANPALAQTSWVGKSLHPQGALESMGWASAPGIQGGRYTLPDTVSTYLPAIWRGSPESVEILDPRPQGWWGGQVYGAYGNRQIGYVYSNTTMHAAMWSSAATTFVDLHPTTGYYGPSNATYIFGNQVVGWVTKFGDSHAALWDISTGKFTDLNPRGATTSGAGATDGVRQGGAAYITSLGMGRALIWNGSPNNYIDITPTGSRGASVRAMTAGTQVGFSQFVNLRYAALWHNSAESFINLAPPQAYECSVAATTGAIHVGWVRILSVGDHACAWISDSPNGFIDLHPFLGPGYGSSDAAAVSVQGSIVTVVGTASTNTGRIEAVMWTARFPIRATLH